MESPLPTPPPDAPPAGAPSAQGRGEEGRGEKGRGEISRALLQLALTLGALVVAVALASWVARDELNALGRGFVDRFGLGGMFVGTFLADAFSFPIPPQFYMLTAITAGGSQAAALATISAASLLAGQTGYHLAGRLARVRLFALRIEASRPKIDRLFARYGYWAIAVASVTPIPFSVLCYISGLYRIPPRYFAALLLFRVPRIVAYYGLIRLGWGQG